jgi:hypothetical protein
MDCLPGAAIRWRKSGEKRGFQPRKDKGMQGKIYLLKSMT